MDAFVERLVCRKCGGQVCDINYTPPTLIQNAQGNLIDVTVMDSNDYNEGRFIVICNRCEYRWEMATL
jgi:hypothetical protein